MFARVEPRLVAKHQNAFRASSKTATRGIVAAMVSGTPRDQTVAQLPNLGPHHILEVADARHNWFAITRS